MHQTRTFDSLNLPGPKHIKKVCLERHLTEGEVAGVGEPPAVNDNNGDGIRHSQAALVSVVPVEGRCLDCRHSSTLARCLPFYFNAAIRCNNQRTALCPNSAAATAGHSAEEGWGMGIGPAPRTRPRPPPHQRIHHQQQFITLLSEHSATALPSRTC